ncbi:MAG: HD domain-containing protein, partial [Eggerthellaceae bacterium]|nr:HD domain-containing protein [Eggerthellaceae bacterium]
FTMNAIAYNPRAGIFDPHQGIQDIHNHIIRTVGNPNMRFREDALRIMRALRFASQLGFTIEDGTAAAIQTHAKRLNMVAYERIEDEFSRLLLGDYACDIIVSWIDVIGVFIPEARAMKGFDQKTKYHIYDVLEHSAHVVAHAPKKRIVRYAAFFHDIGKPRVFTQDEDGIGHFYGHAPAGAEMTRKVLARLRLKKTDATRIVALVAMHQDMIAATPASVRRALHRIQGDVELFRDLLDLKRADAFGHAPQFQDRADQADEVEQVLNAVLEEDAAFCVQNLKVDGHDIINYGIPAGPAVGALLDMLLDAVIDGMVDNNRDELLSFISDRAHNMHR